MGPITLDIYPDDAGEMTGATLYEDDTTTTAYQHGQFRTTEIMAAVTQGASKTVRVDIGAATGDFAGAIKTRSWKLRIHVPSSWPKNLLASLTSMNGGRVMSHRSFPPRARAERRCRLAIAGAPDGEVFELTLPPVPVTEKQSIELSFRPRQ